MSGFVKIASLVIVSAALMTAATWLFLADRGRAPLHEAVSDLILPPAIAPRPPERVFFLGDIMLARDVERRLKAEGPDHAFNELLELKSAKAVVGNFEASVPAAHEPTPNLAMKFSVDASLLPILSAGGVTHLSLANNHALDHLEEGYRNTVRELKGEGFGVFGHPAWVSERDSVSYLEAGGRTFALVGINATYGPPREEEWRGALEAAAAKSDLQIAYVHWGEEYELRHGTAQERLAHALVDAGADMVIGHHPHVVQDIEEYNGALIFYSLGNFIFDQYFSRDVQEGLMVELVISKEGAEAVLHPVESRTVRVQPKKMAGQEREAFLAGLAARSDDRLREDIRAGSVPLQF